MTNCSIIDCQRPVRSKGYCNAHYLRWYRHGDPEHGEMLRGTARDWLLKHVEHDGEECLIWPFARNSKGYPDVRFAGMEGMLAHRVMCVLAHGDPPEPKMDAAHSCGNGQTGCINPRHLSWKTRIDNHADKKRHGTQIWGDQIHFAKLTLEQARIAKYDGRSARFFANAFGVSVAAINHLRAGRTWKGI